MGGEKLCWGLLKDYPPPPGDLSSLILHHKVGRTLDQTLPITGMSENCRGPPDLLSSVINSL